MFLDHQRRRAAWFCTALWERHGSEMEKRSLPREASVWGCTFGYVEPNVHSTWCWGSLGQHVIQCGLGKEKTGEHETAKSGACYAVVTWPRMWCWVVCGELNHKEAAVVFLVVNSRSFFAEDELPLNDWSGIWRKYCSLRLPNGDTNQTLVPHPARALWCGLYHDLLEGSSTMTLIWQLPCKYQTCGFHLHMVCQGQRIATSILSHSTCWCQV